MRAIRGKVLIEIKKKMEDTVKYGNMELMIDPMFKPEHNARIYGTVIGISKNEEELQIGDKDYFHYLVVSDSHVYGNVYSVLRERIFCYVRDKIYPLGYWTLCLPFYDEKADIVEIDGKEVEVIKQGNIVTAVSRRPSAKRTRISKIGRNRLKLKNDDVVYCERGFEFENMIEGTNYYCVKQVDIVGKA